MNPLAWNFEIPQRMRTQPQIALGVLPIGLLFASFAPLFFLAASLSSILGIPDNAPIKDQPNGMLWLIIFLVVMVILMIAGYLLGWFLNAIVLRVFFKWPQEKVRRVLLYSEVPPSWLKETNTAAGTASSGVASTATWAVTRQKGKLHFIFQHGVLAWGLPMYLFMAVLPVINGRVEPTAFYFIWQACLWGAAGASFGLVIWYFSEKSYLKQHGKQEP
jgi:MFS family permease